MIQSVERAFRLLEALDAAGGEGFGLLELSTTCGLKPPTARSLLCTLASLGYVTQAGAGGRYALGDAALRLGRGSRGVRELVRVAQPVLAELAGSLGETVVLAVLRQSARHTVLTVESPQALRVAPARGIDRRFYDTATGRCLLSGLAADDLAALTAVLGLPGGVWAGCDSAPSLRRELAALRARGWAAYGSAERDVQALAVPVDPGDLGIPCSLGVYYPTGRIAESAVEDVIATLRHAAAAITRGLRV